MHEDYRSLERAKEAMIDVSQYINEVKRDSDHLVIIQKVKVSKAIKNYLKSYYLLCVYLVIDFRIA